MFVRNPQIDTFFSTAYNQFETRRQKINNMICHHLIFSSVIWVIPTPFSFKIANDRWSWGVVINAFLINSICGRQGESQRKVEQGLVFKRELRVRTHRVQCSGYAIRLNMRLITFTPPPEFLCTFYRQIKGGWCARVGSSLSTYTLWRAVNSRLGSLNINVGPSIVIVK